MQPIYSLFKESVFHFYYVIFFYFTIYNNVNPKYCDRYKKSKESSYYSIKHLKQDLLLLGANLTEKIPDPRNAEEHYQPFIRQKHKIRKAIKNNYLSSKNFSKPKHC